MPQTEGFVNNMSVFSANSIFFSFALFSLWIILLVQHSNFALFPSLEPRYEERLEIHFMHSSLIAVVCHFALAAEFCPPALGALDQHNGNNSWTDSQVSPVLLCSFDGIVNLAKRHKQDDGKQDEEVAVSSQLKHVSRCSTCYLTMASLSSAGYTMDPLSSFVQVRQVISQKPVNLLCFRKAWIGTNTRGEWQRVP